MSTNQNSADVSNQNLTREEKKRKSGETKEQWLLRLGFEPVSEEQRKKNIDDAIDWFSR